MGWGASQWLRVTKEATYGTYNASPGAGDVAWFRLATDNAFGMRTVPQRQVIRSADGGNRRRQQVAARKVCAGALATLWYPSQSLFLLDAALKLTANDLTSYTLDYYDTVQTHRFLGAKVQTLTLQGNAQQDYIPASVGWVAQKRDATFTTLAQPANTVFPSEVPYEHVESKGLLSIGGTVTKYSSLGLTITNTLAGTWDEDQFITALYYAGRDVDLSARLQYLSATMRNAFESQSALTISAAWARSGGLTSTLNLGSLNYIPDADDELPLGDATYQTFNFQSFFETGAGTDVAYTVA